MRKTLSAILVARESLFAVLLVLSLATAGFGDTFTFGFNGPRAIVGGLGETVGVTYQMTLCHDNPEGKPLAAGWSLSAVADNATKGLSFVERALDGIRGSGRAGT